MKIINLTGKPLPEPDPSRKKILVTNILIPSNRIPRDAGDWLALETPFVEAGGVDFYDGWGAGPFPGGWFDMTQEERNNEKKKGHIFRTLYFNYFTQDERDHHLEELRKVVPWFVKIVSDDKWR